MKKSILKTSDIVFTEKLYPRVKVNDSTIKRYVKDMNRGDVFPPLYIGLFKGKHYLIDGNHRLEAYKILGEQYIQCEVKTNFTEFNDMFLAAYRANEKHGYRMNDRDRMKVAKILGDMSYDIGDINKITGISSKKIESAIKGRISHVLIKDKVKSGEFPKIITEKIPEKEQLKIIDDKEIKKIEEGNQEEFELYQLEEIYNYLNEEKFLDDKKITGWLRKIKAMLHKRYPKL